MKKSDKNVNISAFYQRAFIAAAAVAWLVQAGIILYEAISNHGYRVAEIWLFQLSGWGLPLYFFILSLVFYRKRYMGQKLLFMSAFMATVAMLFYDGLLTIGQGVFGLYISRHVSSLGNNNFWNGPGFISIMLGLGVVLYPAALYLIRKRNDL